MWPHGQWESDRLRERLDLDRRPFALNAVTESESGTHTFGLSCSESSGNLTIANVHISAVTLGPN